MPNPSYTKGARHERELVNIYKARGWLAARSAGSHSPVDVWAVGTGEDGSPELHLIQVKGAAQNVHMPRVPKMVRVRTFLMWKWKGTWQRREL